MRTNVWFYLRCGCFLELVGRGRRNYHLLDVPEEHLLQEPDDGDDKAEEESAEGGVKGVAVTGCKHSEGRERFESRARQASSLFISLSIMR